MSLNPSDAPTLDTVGCVYSYTGNHEKAVEPFRLATNKKPENPEFQFNFAASLRFLGDFDAAATAYERAIQADPKFFRAHWALSNLERQTPDRNHIERLQRLLPLTAGDAEAHLYVSHALAKELEDIGDYERAFTALSAGKIKMARTINYVVDGDAMLFSKVQKLFTADFLADSLPGHSSNEPIFIVGMPRSGTTLAERILSSHSQVYSAGELQNFGVTLKQAANTSSNRVLDIETLDKAIELDFPAQGTRYVESTRPATGKTAHFIDKMPMNFLYVGFIHLCLPNARIICLRRNPMDTCLGNFRQLFALNFGPYYDYAYDIIDTGKYFILFDRLMQHWKRVLPGKILEVHYESIVENQEIESRRLVDFCGLQWEDTCLEFEKNTAAVATASAVQVREPIYATAVARWKHYEEQLQPLRDLLESEGILVD
jgi:tetratricopeptide (TPR) repeat protein